MTAFGPWHRRLYQASPAVRLVSNLWLEQQGMADVGSWPYPGGDYNPRLSSLCQDAEHLTCSAVRADDPDPSSSAGRCRCLCHHATNADRLAITEEA